MSNQTDHTIVRLRVPPELKQKIEESAEQNNRSQSADMVARLEESFENQIPDSIVSAVINTFLMGLISRYESQKSIHLALLPKAEQLQDIDTINMVSAEAERCEMLIKELKELLFKFGKPENTPIILSKKAP